MRKTIHRLINRAGFHVSRTDNGKPKWSATVDDYYPIDVRPRWGYGRSAHAGIENLLTAELDSYCTLLDDFRRFGKLFESVSYTPVSPTLPHWNNIWFSTMDAAALMYFLASRVPKNYVEIGSGHSTKFARCAITWAKSSTTVTSIDPHPRSEIDTICTKVVRTPLEETDPSVFDHVQSGDIVFYDGSHRVFTNSDATTFFLDVLPRLKAGVLVHVHDIFWPDDYPPEWNGRLYSEQYLLGMMLVGGCSRYRVVLPNYFVSKNQRTARLISELGIPVTYPGSTKPGLSFWLEVL